MKTQNILKPFGGVDIKLKAKKEQADFTVFQIRIMRCFCASALISTMLVVGLYLFLWKRRMGDWMVYLMEAVWKIDHEEAFYLYNDYFRGLKEIFFAVAIILIFLLLLWSLFRWMTRYFKEIDNGIDGLLSRCADPIHLSPEMRPFEVKLNTVQDILAQREQAARAAEQRKNELVMYLAHDIRTPLTSIIGYLNLLEQIPTLPPKEAEKYIHIALEKTYRLGNMIEEFFEITRYNTQQIAIDPQTVDLYYLLVQAIDEHIPLFAARGNYVTFKAAEPLQAVGDAEKLARVFNNLLKNAAAYSDAGTEVIVRAEETPDHIVVSVSSTGQTIPHEKLDALFEKFYRLDESRTSGTGGTGLGLAIAKEIVALHGGVISANSENGQTTFVVKLPVAKEP